MVIWALLVALAVSTHWWGPRWAASRMARQMIANGKGPRTTEGASPEADGDGTAPIADRVTS